MNSMDEKAARFTRMLSEMKEEYLKTLPRKISLIERLISEEKWQELHDEFHKLKGTGKTYGFPQITEVCLILESLSAQRPIQDKNLFIQSKELLARMHQSYEQNQAFDLENDSFARSLLALK